MAINTYLIAKEYYPLLAVSSFLLSWTWTSNVKRISVSNRFEQFLYASGASVGCILGVLITSYLLKN